VVLLQKVGRIGGRGLHHHPRLVALLGSLRNWKMGCGFSLKDCRLNLFLQGRSFGLVKLSSWGGIQKQNVLRHVSRFHWSKYTCSLSYSEIGEYRGVGSTWDSDTVESNPFDG
jgi:hypothetical protein